MGSNLVIAAIPDENDRVWKVSSEKIPHMTVLFLGDVDKVSNLDQIMLFVEHAANTTLKRFYLPVDRRGELGDDKADVLFFKKGRYDYKAIRDFRATLLQDNNIKTAYDSATQFDGPWNPHLTLGYPETPANKIPDDQNWSFYDVQFNKIAVWTGDFEGPDWLLKDYWDEMEALDAVPMDVAMSNLSHAVKVSDTAWSQFKTSDYTDEQYARACLLDRGKDSGTAKERYGLPVREPDGTLNRNACHAAASVLSSTGGTGTARGNKVKGSPEQIAAAKNKLVALYKGPLDEDVPKGLDGEDSMKQMADLGSEFVLKRVGVKVEPLTKKAPAEENMIQTTDLGAVFLSHVGVKGMHWGQRKSPPSPVATAARSVVPQGAKRKTKIEVEGGENHSASDDAIRVAQAHAKLKKSGTNALSNKELQDVQTRLNLERNVKQLTSSMTTVGKGRQFVKSVTGFGKDVNEPINTGLQTARLVKQLS